MATNYLETTCQLVGTCDGGDRRTKLKEIPVVKKSSILLKDIENLAFFKQGKKVGFHATLSFGFSFLPSSSSGCSSALVPLKCKSGLLICRDFVEDETGKYLH